MESHSPFFLNFIIIAPLFLLHPDFPVEMKWKNNWFSFLLLSSLFSVPKSKIAWSWRVVLLPPFCHSHREKKNKKTITGKITISIMKKLTCHNERVWNWRAASKLTPTTCFWGNKSLRHWQWPSLSAKFCSSGKDVLEEIRITDIGGKGEEKREGGGKGKERRRRSKGEGEGLLVRKMAGGEGIAAKSGD